MNFNNKYPIYKQLADIFISDIIAKKIKSGDKLESIRELAIKYNLNVNTVTNAFKYLENLGLTETKRGLGTYITEDLSIIENIKLNKLNELIDEFIDTMKKMGFSKKEIIEKLQEKGDDKFE